MNEDDDLAAIIAGMREEYGAHAAASLAAIDAVLAGGPGDTPDMAAWAEIARHAHSLKGTGATFGFPEVSELAAHVEQLARRLPQTATFDAFAEALGRLRHAVASL